MRKLRRKTWRWFVVRLDGLTDDSAWKCALYPTDPATGERRRADGRDGRTMTLTDASQVDAFIASQGQA